MPQPHPAPAAARDSACIHTLFTRQAADTPARIALVHGRAHVSYAALDARAERVARRIVRHGAGPESLVGVFLPRTPDLVAALLGVLRAGAAYLPLDPAYPPERVRWMLDDARASLVLTGGSAAARLPAHGGRTLRMESIESPEPGDDASAPLPEAAPENLAYVVYTSGSTGRPKGVMIEHRNAVPVLRWMRGMVDDDARRCALAATSVCFDVSVAEIFGTLCWGGTLVLVDDALALASTPAPVRLASMVPTAAAELLRLGAFPPTLRTLALGGEPVSRGLADALYARTAVERILNLYGPTEDTTYSTCAVLPRDPAAPVTVGVPVDGGAVRVLDDALRPVPDGAAGELWMAGAGVTRGYVRRPAATAERWLPDPLSPVPGARMYRSGDAGRRRADGEYDVLGRRDRQVKVRGFRVEPEEVEAALAGHSAVAEAAVVARASEDGDVRLVAYTAPADAPGGAALRTFLRARLPDYMVPSAFVAVDALPRTPNGKVDRLALPDAAPARERDAAAFVAARTAVEEIVCGVWAEVLGMERVGARDDFFALGGHSLRAVQVAARLRDALGVELPLPAVFAAPTVEALARAVEGAMGAAHSAPPSIPRAPRDRPLPLSPAQEAVWFFERLSPGMRSYQFQAAVRMRGALDADALGRTLDEIVRRHEIFRTTFREVAGAPVQEVHLPTPVPLPREDVRALSPEERDARFAADFAHPFDPGVLPLARWTLFRTGDHEHVLLCVEHHLVHDGWSFGVFLRELTAIYAAFVRGAPCPLPEPALQFADFAAWQRAWRASDEAARSLAFWRGALAGAPTVLELPADHPRPPRVTFRGRSLHLRLPPELARAADAFGRAHGATLYMTLLAAFQALVHRCTGRTDFILGGGSAGRRTRASEELIGMIVNVVPLRADLAGDPDFAVLVRRVRATALAAYPHADVPLADIVEAVRPQRSPDRLPLVQATFNMHHAPYPDLRLPGLELEVTEALGNETAKFDLQVIVIPRAQQNAAAGDEVTMIWEYATDLFERETIERMWRQYQALLASLLADPARPVSAARMMDEDERRRVVEGWNRTASPYPQDAGIAALFAETVRRAPDAEAIDGADGRRMTFAEVDAASSRVARRLRGLGLAAEARIGIAIDRMPSRVVAILAAVKAGGAYVPLDLSYPPARLAWMMEDAGVSALLVDEAPPPALADHAGPVVQIAGVDSENEAGDDDPSTQIAWGDSLACVLYTSGSTGTPKGIALTHRGLVRLARGADHLPVGPHDRVAQTASASFDAFSWELWAAMLNGACLVEVARPSLLSPPDLAARLREGRVTHLFLTTALLHQVARTAPETLGGVGTVLFGGDAADPDAVRRARDAVGPGRLLNVYGPAENTTFTTWHRVDGVPARAASVPIGRPVANTRVYVLDARMAPLPVGVPGEVYAGGDGLARGYVGRPGATAERFVPDPFGAPGSRLYRTGDRARWLPAGVLEFLGRADAQVKVRGFRVEPGEVEAALRADPAVADAAVAARADADGGHALVAWVAPRGGDAMDTAALRARLAARLPPYLLPAALIPVDAIPLTPNGKVDRAALPHPPPAVEAAPPLATEEERAVAEAWRAMLGAASPGPEDDFFALGGHSLQAARVAAQIGEALGITLPVSAVFDAPTLRALAARAAAARAEAAALLRSVDWLEGISEEEALALLSESGEA